MFVVGVDGFGVVVSIFVEQGCRSHGAGVLGEAITVENNLKKCCAIIAMFVGCILEPVLCVCNNRVVWGQESVEVVCNACEEI